ncbi:MAG: Hpt domain-containing protein [Maribacter sp.]|uniref:Hpt domain-containing protein n=1 Tax=Maribacter sp. TaxID=1897614 RepID=UPI003296A6D4
MQETPNLNYIKELSGDDKTFEQKFIQILKDEFPVEQRTYIDHIERDEPRMAGELVHKLKHKFNILSMSEAYEYAIQYEEELRAGGTKGDAGFRSILETIKNYLNTI